MDMIFELHIDESIILNTVGFIVILSLMCFDLSPLIAIGLISVGTCC
jgi:hypothetical protein